MRVLLALVLLAGAALAGCATPGAEPDPLGPAGDPADPTPDETTPPGRLDDTPPPEGDPAPTDNGSEETPPASPGGSATPPPAPAWPALEDAKVRPGTQVFYQGSQCTSNFVFTSPDNRTLYLGVAAHCFGPAAEVGDPVDIGGGVATGTLAYSSWLVMGSDGGDPTTGAGAVCSVEEDQAVCDSNDFALVRVDAASKPLVHPAMLHFGGPTALAPSPEVREGDKVLTYGHSDLRFGLDVTNWHEGYVLLGPDPWTTTTYTATPGVPGDSGSGVLLGDGRAFGVLVTVQFAPLAGANGVTSLDLALAYALEKAGLDARLATWDLLDEGALPGL